MDPEEFDIVDHAINRAAGGLFCGDSPAMQRLVADGLMEPAGRKSFVPEPYFRVTDAGRAEWEKHRPKPAKTSTRSQRRFRRWLDAAAEVISFGDWLKTEYADSR
jgi:hypothetical protein